MKTLICTVAFTLALTSSNPALASGVLRDAKAPHLVHSGGVKSLFLQRRIWLYPVYGRSVDMTADVRMGIARIQT